ncbi:M20 metallopeptidase family protein [Paenibacillus physcomitrellae]|uniref:Amidohydrolase YhaA n=1 Tax=Paenibacillus physcomitrellae TaxID=1619311 RepID=A0ABQ1FLA7_9BACL|nr:amidohydrolase [Paenibacillus physcomitrellae]GGA21090.1 putative amidohydrolase YhaA [Paenibacillus physcomitrellae]
MYEALAAQLAEQEQQLIEWRRFMHQHPELSFQEINTAHFIANQLRSFGIEIRTGVGGNGIVGVIRGGSPGPRIAFRADFDALPIQDEKDVPYKSTVPGVMHACGHDGHTSILLGVARLLQEHREKLKGELVLIFQHAEEKPPGGAIAMIEDGCLEGVDAVYGIHLASELPLGTFGVKTGPMNAAVDAFTIKVYGKGGHGARPHQTVDALVIASQIVGALQQIVSRRVNPIESAVVTVGQFVSGTAFNVIADKAELQGTVRTFNPEVRKQVEQELRKIVQGLCEASGARAEIDYLNGYPPLVNPAAETERMRGLITQHFKGEALLEIEASMGAEDFAYYLEHRPGNFIEVGSRTDDEGTQYPHHHPMFDFDERAMLQAAKLFLAIAEDYLG